MSKLDSESSVDSADDDPDDIQSNRSPVMKKKKKLKTSAGMTLFRTEKFGCVGKNEQVRKDKWVQFNENDHPLFVLMHVPKYESFFGSLHPISSLFEQSFNLTNAQEQMYEFQRWLKSKGIRVLSIQDILIESSREKLIDLAAKILHYTLDVSKKRQRRLKDDVKKFLSEEYKLETLQKMSSENLVDILLLRPEVVLELSKQNTQLHSVNFNVKPLPNLLFTRDQQITTKKGVVIGNLNSPQRSIETEILEVVWNKLGISPIGRIPQDETPEMHLEGGDFFPLSEDVSMIGVGLRTSYNAVEYLMKNDLFGTSEVAIVVDLIDLDQNRMHLDTFFNILSEEIVVLLEDIYDANSERNKFYRRVDIYERRIGRKTNRSESTGDYHFVESMSFREYLEKRHRFRVVTIPNKYQLEYMINFLNLGRNLGVATVHSEFEKVMEEFYQSCTDEKLKKVELKYFNFSSVHSMWGAVHCSTQVSRCPT